jgi:hypothetical protein
MDADQRPQQPATVNVGAPALVGKVMPPLWQYFSGRGKN